MKNFLFLSIYILFITQVFGQNTKDYSFEIEISGNGNHSILFIPGFACSSDVWSETIALYENNFTCYALTMAGFSGVKPGFNPSFENWKTEIVNYIKEKKIEKPILIGHSMGGALAMAIAADWPELIEKIVIVDALPCLTALLNPNFKHQKNIDCKPIINHITSLTEEQFYQMQKASIPQLIQNETMRKTVINWSMLSDRHTFAEVYCDFFNTDIREKIKNIQCPTLVLLESNFKDIKPSIEDQYKNLKLAELRYANKGLHFIMYDDKEWYFDQLANFLIKD